MFDVVVQEMERLGGQLALIEPAGAHDISGFVMHKMRADCLFSNSCYHFSVFTCLQQAISLILQITMHTAFNQYDIQKACRINMSSLHILNTVVSSLAC